MFNLSSLFKSTAIALFSFMSIAICAGNANSPNPSIFVSGLCNNLNSWIQASQTRITVYGVVKEAGSNQPLVGVNVYIKGTTEGTITDSEGGYSLSLPDGKHVLVFSSIGFKNYECDVNSSRELNVTLDPDSEMLSEVVYIGYMSQKKADITGAISIVDNRDIKKTSANAMKSLQGKLAGVKITTGGGNPAESIGIQIRGLSSLSGAVTPLIVLDGMPTQNLNLRDINTGDIESIQVLKDAASASIYGARASGGVILIQTKKGKSGNLKVDYEGNFSISSVINRPKLMNTEEFGIAAFKAAAYDEWAYGSALLFPNGYQYEYHRGDDGMYVMDNMTINEYLDKDHLVKTSNTDWMDEIYRTALSHNHQLTISQGTDKCKTLFALGFLDNQGTQIYSFFRKYSARVNTEFNLIKNRVKIGENIAVSYLRYKDQSQTFNAMIMPSIVPVRDINGNWAGPAGFDDIENPVMHLTIGKDNIEHYVKIIGDIYADVNFGYGISARTQFGIDYGNAYHRWIDGKYVETGFRSNDKNYVTSSQSHPLNYVWTNTVSFDRNFGNHSINAVAGCEYTKFVQEGFSARRNGLYLEDRDFAHLGVATGDEITLNSSADEYVYFSLFAKANYSYTDKYFLSATVRRDGSSLFGSKHRYGVFPAFSLGWRISKEPFMSDYEFLSDLKLRMSWGENGSVQGLPRGYTTTPFTTDYNATAYPIGGQESGTLQSGYRRTWLGNPDLKWETTSQWDCGFDYGFLNQRITGAFDFYYKKTKDILVQTPYIAAMGEGGEPWINGASMNNRGVEFSITYKSNPTKEFLWSVTGNIGTYKTKLTELPSNVINKYAGDGVNDLIIGHSPNEMYGLVADGIFRTQEEVDNHADQQGKAVGRIRYKDLDGDGVVNEVYDRTWIGNWDPDFFGGITFDFVWKNLDLNIFFEGVFGNQVNSDWKKESDIWLYTNPAWKNHATRMLDAWSPSNPTSDIPAITNNTSNHEERFSSYFVQDGSYLKLRNLEFGYTLPKTISSKAAMNNLRFYVSASNVFTLKKFWGKDKFTSFDPEYPSYSYLPPFVFNVGVNITF